MRGGHFPSAASISKARQVFPKHGEHFQNAASISKAPRAFPKDSEHFPSAASISKVRRAFLKHGEHFQSAVDISQARRAFPKASRAKQGMPKQRAMSNTPKFWLGPGELHEWIGEANLSRDENSVFIAVSAEAVLNAYAQWYESQREASVEMAVWKRRCDHLLVISEQATKLHTGTLNQKLIVQKIKLHEPKRFDGSQDMEVVAQYLEDVQHFVRQGGAVCQGASEDNQKIDTFWRFLTGKVFHWFENSMKKQGVDAIPPEEYNYNITWDDMKVLFKRQYVPERAISVICREWYALKFSHQLVLSFNKRALELISILGGSLTITRKNPLWGEYLIKLPEAKQNDISQQARLMNILGNGSQMTLSSMMDIVTARMLPFQPMPSGSAILVLNTTENNEVNTIVDGKIQSRFEP